MRQRLTLIWALWPLVVGVAVVSFVIYSFVYEHQAGHRLAERREQDFYRYYAECIARGELNSSECSGEANLLAFADNPGSDFQP